MNPFPEVLPQSEPVQQDEEEDEGVMEVWEARRDDRDFCHSSIKEVKGSKGSGFQSKIHGISWLPWLPVRGAKTRRPTPIGRHPFPFGDVKPLYLLKLTDVYF